MQPIFIDEQLAATCPAAVLGCLQTAVTVEETPSALTGRLMETAERLRTELPLADIVTLPGIEAARAGYRACGKDPHRYRNAAEALLRRTVQGKPLPAINSAVDAGNLVSLACGCPLGMYDLAAVRGRVIWRIAAEGERYRGIGRDELNLAGMPVLTDEVGLFGSPTSDSERTMVTRNTRELLVVIYAFGGRGEARRALGMAEELLTVYAGAGKPEIVVIGGDQAREG